MWHRITPGPSSIPNTLCKGHRWICLRGDFTSCASNPTGAVSEGVSIVIGTGRLYVVIFQGGDGSNSVHCIWVPGIEDGTRRRQPRSFRLIRRIGLPDAADAIDFCMVHPEDRIAGGNHDIIHGATDQGMHRVMIAFQRGGKLRIIHRGVRLYLLDLRVTGQSVQLKMAYHVHDPWGSHISSRDDDREVE